MKEFHLKNLSSKNRVAFNSEKDKELATEYSYTLDHSDVWKHSIFRARCPQYDACKSCDDFYDMVELPPKFQERLRLPNKKNNGALFYEPEPDPKHPEHYRTFLA